MTNDLTTSKPTGEEEGPANHVAAARAVLAAPEVPDPLANLDPASDAARAARNATAAKDEAGRIVSKPSAVAVHQADVRLREEARALLADLAKQRAALPAAHRKAFDAVHNLQEIDVQTLQAIVASPINDPDLPPDPDETATGSTDTPAADPPAKSRKKADA